MTKEEFEDWFPESIVFPGVIFTVKYHPGGSYTEDGERVYYSPTIESRARVGGRYCVISMDADSKPSGAFKRAWERELEYEYDSLLKMARALKDYV